MSFNLVVWVFAGAIFSALVTFILCRVFTKRSQQTLLKAQSDKERQAAINSIKRENALVAQRNQYEKLLNDANDKCEDLETRLKYALKGGHTPPNIPQSDEVEKLKKQIKSLNDDLDERDDDLADKKKKLIKKDNEISELQNSLSVEQKNVKTLSDDLQNTKQELENTISNLTLKVDALGFVQEILKAEDIGNSDYTALVKNIDMFESFVKGQYLDLNLFLFNESHITWNNVGGQQGFNTKKNYIVSSFDQWASTKKKSWLYNKTTVAFVGEFSAGKTTIVNRILSQDNPNAPKLPVSVQATTAIPTYITGLQTITGAQVPSYQYISGDGKSKVILEETFKKVSKELLDQIKVSSMIKYFVMTYNNPNLKGLSILDTPGFNSKDKDDGLRTIEVINECDALFWVVDVNIGEINRSSLQIIKEKLNKPLYLVINQVDTKPEADIQKVEKKIKQTLEEAGVYPKQYIRFSNKTPLNIIMDPIKKVTKIEARDTFVNDLENDIKKTLDSLYWGVKSFTDIYNSKHKEGELITNQFNDRMKSLQSDCTTAEEIPQYKPGVKVFDWNITDDKFTMSVDQTNELNRLLSNISGRHMNALRKAFEKRFEKAEEIQKAWSDLCDIKNAWQKTSECLEQFNRIKKSIS